jgi:hypothetical protein
MWIGSWWCGALFNSDGDGGCDITRAFNPRFWESGRFAPLAFGQGTDDYVKVAVAEHFGRGIGFTMRGGFRDEAVNYLKADFLVRFLPTFEAQLDSDFHVVPQKSNGVIEFGLEIVRIDGRAELKFFHATTGLLLAFLRLGFFVQEFAVIDDAADRGRSSGGDLDEIELAISSQLQGGIEAHDAELLFVLADHADFASANLAVSAVGWFVTLKFVKRTHQDLGGGMSRARNGASSAKGQQKSTSRQRIPNSRKSARPVQVSSMRLGRIAIYIKPHAPAPHRRARVRTDRN